jgi:hypothetical protein
MDYTEKLGHNPSKIVLSPATLNEISCQNSWDMIYGMRIVIKEEVPYGDILLMDEAWNGKVYRMQACGNGDGPHSLDMVDTRYCDEQMAEDIVAIMIGE